MFLFLLSLFKTTLNFRYVVNSAMLFSHLWKLFISLILNTTSRQLELHTSWKQWWEWSINLLLDASNFLMFFFHDLKVCFFFNFFSVSCFLECNPTSASTSNDPSHDSLDMEFSQSSYRNPSTSSYTPQNDEESFLEIFEEFPPEPSTPARKRQAHQSSSASPTLTHDRGYSPSIFD